MLGEQTGIYTPVVVSDRLTYVFPFTCAIKVSNFSYRLKSHTLAVVVNNRLERTGSSPANAKRYAGLTGKRVENTAKARNGLAENTASAKISFKIKFQMQPLASSSLIY